MANNKVVKMGSEARRKMVEGVNTLADAVGSTLGPNGRLAALKRSFGPTAMTKDGVTVAKEIKLSDSEQDAGAQLCARVAIRCDQQAGDGTSTATVLAQAMINQGMKSVESGTSPAKIKIGMLKAKDIVVNHLAMLKTPISIDDHKDIIDIASISANSEEDGAIVADAFIKAGEHGTVASEDSQTSETVVDHKEGMSIEQGYLTPYFMNNMNKQTCEFDEPYILLWDKSISNPKDILPVLEMTAKAQKPLCIIADNVTGDALATILKNLPQFNEKGMLQAVCVKAPGWAERRKGLMSDLAIVTGGKFFDEALGADLKNVTEADLGTCKTLLVTQNSTTFIGAHGSKDRIDEQVKSLQNQMKTLTSDFDKEKIQERIAKLKGGVSIIRIGSTETTDLAERRFRFEDAIKATRAALEEGIVPGGGTALIAANKELESHLNNESDVDVRIGMSIVAKALLAPIKRICENGDMNHMTVLNNITEGIKRGKPTKIFNAKSDTYEDTSKSKIKDPLKVVRLAVDNSVTLAALFLSTEVLITDEPEDRTPMPMMDAY